MRLDSPPSSSSSFQGMTHHHHGQLMHLDSHLFKAMIGAYEATGQLGAVVELFNLVRGGN